MDPLSSTYIFLCPIVGETKEEPLTLTLPHQVLNQNNKDKESKAKQYHVWGLAVNGNIVLIYTLGGEGAVSEGLRP